MRYLDVTEGWLYAITVRPMWFEPHIAVKNGNEVYFVHAQKFDYPLSPDGPHHVCPEMKEWATANGQKFEEDQIFSLWSERLTIENLEEITDMISKTFNEEDAQNNWDIEMLKSPPTASQNTQKAVEELSSYLRRHETWEGSSASVIYDSSGEFAGSFVTLFTANPYLLAALLRWIDVPVGIIQNVTRVEYNP
jgi:hypothetical protein